MSKFLCAFLLTLPFSAHAEENQRKEPHVPGCQDLESWPANKISLRGKGKVYVTYLPDGKRYSHLKPPSPPDFFELGVLDLDKPELGIKRLTVNAKNESEVRVSPDGKKMVWVERPARDLFDGETTIFVANTDMTDKRVLAHGPATYLTIPSFVKPEGKKVIYVTQGEGDTYAKLMLADLQTGTTVPYQSGFKGGIVDPQMSRDGKKIVFKSRDHEFQTDTGEAQIYIMNADGSGAKRLTRGGCKDEDPAFSPDGKSIAFERVCEKSDHKGKNKNDEFWKVGMVKIDLETGKETQLIEFDVCGKNELWLPTWSPDGEYIMFTRGLHFENGEGINELWVMRKDGTDVQRVPGSDGAMFLDWVK